MDIKIVANSTAIKTLDLRAEAILDSETDNIYVSASTEKNVTISFWPNAEGIKLGGVPVQSLSLSPFTLAKLTATNGEIKVEKLAFNSLRAQTAITELKEEISAIQTKGASQPKGLRKAQKTEIAELEDKISKLELLIANPVVSLENSELVQATQLNSAAFWNFTVPYVKGETKFDVTKMRKIQAEDLDLLNSL